jgi:hypothetical protein
MVDLSDPLLWLFGGIALMVTIFLLIYFNVFREEPRPGARVQSVRTRATSS